MNEGAEARGKRQTNPIIQNDLYHYGLRHSCQFFDRNFWTTD
jgi:hypothetical protein